MINIATNPIWFTPTSYGLVITKIDSQRNLQRIYLDKEAASELINGESEKIYKSLASKGITHNELHSNLDTISRDLTECDKLVSRNNWRLFSLYPLQFSVQTVNYCNAKCDFCYANTPNTLERKTMELDRLYALKDYATLHGTKFGVSGGEPLLHPHIYDILNYRNDEVFDTLITNLTPNFDFNRLVQTEVDLVQVSIHGHGKIHDEILGVNSAYDKVRNRIIELMKDINIGTNTVITPKNIHTIETLVYDFDTIQKTVGKKFTYVRFVPVLPSGTGYDKYATNTDFVEDVKTLLTKLMKKYEDLEFEVPILHSNPYEYFYDGNRWVCPAGSTVAVVRIDGRVTPCNQFLDTAVCSTTSIDQKNFHKIWIEDPVLSKMRRGIPSDSGNVSCKECRYLIMKDKNQLFKKE